MLLPILAVSTPMRNSNAYCSTSTSTSTTTAVVVLWPNVCVCLRSGKPGSSAQCGRLRAVSSFQWKNPDFLIKNPDFLLKNPDFLLKNVDFMIKQAALALQPRPSLTRCLLIPSHCGGSSAARVMPRPRCCLQTAGRRSR